VDLPDELMSSQCAGNAVSGGFSAI